jgi:hypothetical protein
VGTSGVPIDSEPPGIAQLSTLSLESISEESIPAGSITSLEADEDVVVGVAVENDILVDEWTDENVKDGTDAEEGYPSRMVFIIVAPCTGLEDLADQFWDREQSVASAGHRDELRGEKIS